MVVGWSSYQESVADDPRRSAAASGHLKERSNALRRRDLGELEVLRADGPVFSSEGEGDVHLSITRI